MLITLAAKLRHLKILQIFTLLSNRNLQNIRRESVVINMTKMLKVPILKRDTHTYQR